MSGAYLAALESERLAAERQARELAAKYAQPYSVFLSSGWENGVRACHWLVSPLGERRDPGPYVKGCAHYRIV